MQRMVYVSMKGQDDEEGLIQTGVLKNRAACEALSNLP